MSGSILGRGGEGVMAKRKIGLDPMERAVIALIEHRSLKKAAVAVGVHPVTLWRWLKMPHFREQLRDAQNQIYSQELARLQRLAPQAMAIMEDLLVAPDTPPSTRFRVAVYVLEQSKRPFAIEEFRLDDSEPEEALLAANGSGGRSAGHLTDEAWDDHQANVAQTQSTSRASPANSSTEREPTREPSTRGDHVKRDTCAQPSASDLVRNWRAFSKSRAAARS